MSTANYMCAIVSYKYARVDYMYVIVYNTYARVDYRRARINYT
jgi:hypothetical protein